MQLTHSFTVPVDRPTAWAAFQDISAVAECFPGAAVTSVEGDTFEGLCKVKLGPIALQYAGSGAFLERDAAAYRLHLEAKGRDKRGNGTAGANVTAEFAEEAPSSTRVDVVTDLHITGKPAQFGRGVMQEVSDKLLMQFLDCLEARVGPPPGPPAEAAAEPAAEPVAESAATPVAEGAQAAGEPAQPSTRPVSEPVREPAPQPVREVPPRNGQEAIDLGRTVLPVLARTYWKPLAGVVAVLLVLRWLRRR